MLEPKIAATFAPATWGPLPLVSRRHKHSMVTATGALPSPVACKINLTGILVGAPTGVPLSSTTCATLVSVKSGFSPAPNPPDVGLIRFGLATLIALVLAVVFVARASTESWLPQWTDAKSAHGLSTLKIVLRWARCCFWPGRGCRIGKAVVWANAPWAIPSYRLGCACGPYSAPS